MSDFDNRIDDMDPVIDAVGRNLVCDHCDGLREIRCRCGAWRPEDERCAWCDAEPTSRAGRTEG